MGIVVDCKLKEVCCKQRSKGKYWYLPKWQGCSRWQMILLSVSKAVAGKPCAVWDYNPVGECGWTGDSPVERITNEESFSSMTCAEGLKPEAWGLFSLERRTLRRNKSLQIHEGLLVRTGYNDKTFSMSAKYRMKNSHLKWLQGRSKLRKNIVTRNRLHKELVKLLVLLKTFYFLQGFSVWRVIKQFTNTKTTRKNQYWYMK